jgi:L-fucose isomerase-like protein
VQGVRFAFIESCRPGEKPLEQGVENFISAVCMVKNFYNMRVLQVGARPQPFKSVMFNETELMERFGVDVCSVGLGMFIKEFRRAETDGGIRTEVEKLKVAFEVGDTGEEALEKLAAIKIAYRALMDRYDCNVLSVECWTAVLPALGIFPCAAYSMMMEEGAVVACESDVLGAVTLALLSCASLGRVKPIFAEFTARHPKNDNAELLWHCGVFCPCTAAHGEKPALSGTKPGFLVRDGEYTLAKLAQQAGVYRLLAGRFKTVEGPRTSGTYLWAEFDDLMKWERHIVEGPYIHHMAEIHGDYLPALHMFCRLVPSIELDMP